MTRRTTPRVSFARAHKAILPAWEISLVFATDMQATKLNTSLRKKSYVPNVLSYEVGPRSGEVVICLAEAKRQAPAYDMTVDNFILFLFIHGCLHLKGRPHGPTMEKEERAMHARLATLSQKNEPTQNRNRHRHRNTPNKGGRR